MLNMKHRMSVTAIFSYSFSALTLLFFICMAVFLIAGSHEVVESIGLEFLTKADWYYCYDRFGAAAMIYGSVVVASIAVAVATPLAFGAAIFTSEFLHGHTGIIIKGFIELLAGIPSVVYGLLGVLYLRPYLFNLTSRLYPESGDTLLTAGILVGVMILPTIVSLGDDAIRGISKHDREVARSLGLTKSETFIHGVLPKAYPGLIAAVLLGIGRAMGETIAVFLVVGRADNRLPDPWYALTPLIEGGQTLTSKLGGSEVFISYGSTLHWSAIVGLGAILFFSTLIFVLLGELMIVSLKRI